MAECMHQIVWSLPVCNNCYRRDRPGGTGGGVFLLVSKQFDSSEPEELKVDNITYCEMVWAKVKIHGSTKLYTVDSEIFARTWFSLIFANLLPREFKVLANIDLLLSKLKIFENGLWWTMEETDTEKENLNIFYSLINFIHKRWNNICVFIKK